MRNRLLVSLGVLSLCVAAVAAQTPAKPAAKAGWKAPRTAWGDPDISGNFTNKYEQGTPFERPDGFEGRKLEDIKGSELADVLKKRKAEADARAPFLAGDPTGQIRGNAAFGDRDEMIKGSRAWMVVDPPDGKIPPMLPEAQQRIRALRRGGSSFSNGPFAGPEELSLYDRCITRGFPSSMLPAIYGDSYQIVQGQGWVGIRYEMIHETRIIPLDGRPHPGSRVQLDMGDARGHFEADTLVVETTNFKQRTAYRNANADTLKITERFTRTSPATVEWSVTVDDPKTWAKPWSFTLPLTVNDAEPVFEYACHEGNYAMHNMLSASRATDKAAADAAVAK